MTSRVLTVSSIEKAPVKEKQYLLPDFDGLYLRVYPTGKKTWIIRSFIGGREKQITIGQYPQMSIQEARLYRDNYKAHQKYGGTDGNKVKLKDVYEDWFKNVIVPTITEKSAHNIALRFSYAAELHEMNTADIRRDDVIRTLNRIAKGKGKDTVRRVAETLRRLFNFAMDQEMITVNPAMRLETNVPALIQWKQGHFVAALNRNEIKALLDAIDAVNSTTVRYALKMIAYTFVRTSELRLATWSEINEQEKIWIVPAAHTKLRRDQIVPLSDQCLRILDEMKKRTFNTRSRIIFQATRGSSPELARTTLLTALRTSMAQNAPKDAPHGVTIHGFRATASTLLHEAEFDHFVIERQLAHVDKNSVSAAYNRAEYIGARRKMMQWYADALDAIQDGRPLPEKP